MAVAALSTSAITLATGPAPAPAGAAQQPEAFAKLVERAKSGEQPPQDAATPEGSAEGEPETALGGDENSGTGVLDGAPKDITIGASPADLLSRITAMVEVANLIGITIPTPVATATPAPVAVPTMTAEPASSGILLATTPGAELPVIRPALAAVGMAAPSAAQVATSLPLTSSLAAAQSVPAARTAPEAKTPVAKAPSESDIAASPVNATPGEATEIVRPAILQKGSEIARLLTSLRSAFAAVDGEAAPVAPSAQTITSQPATIATTAPMVAEANLPQAAVTASSATIEALVATPESIQPGATPLSVGTSDEEVASPSTPATPQTADAPIVTAAMPKAEKAEKVEKAQPAAVAVPLDLPVIDADSPVILAEIAPTSDSDAPADADEAPASPVTASAGTAAPLPVATPSAVAPSASAPTDSLAPETAQVDQIVNRELDLAKDGRWLDQLARDISQTATRDGQLRFQLNPEHLGALTIEIANSASGTAIRMTTESDQARAIIADAQPRLLAEVRAQGLRVSESHVDLNQQQGNGGSTSAQAQQQQQQNRQPSEDSKPFVRTQSGNRDDAVDSAPDSDGELYA